MFINSIFESLKVYRVIKVREVRIAKEVKRSDGWWRFACGDVCKPCACTLCTLSTLWVHLSSYRSAAVLTWWPSSPRNLCWLMDHWLVWWTFDIIDEPKVWVPNPGRLTFSSERRYTCLGQCLAEETHMPYMPKRICDPNGLPLSA